MCTLDVDTAGSSSPGVVLGRGTRECSWGFVAPKVPSAPLCLQTAPRLLGLRPHISPRCSPLSHRPGRLPGPAAVPGWAGPPAAAGGESLPRPVMPPHPLWSVPGGCTVWVRPGVLPEGRARRSVQLSLQRGPPGPGDGAAVLRLPCEHEGLGEWPPLCRARDRWALASLVPRGPLPVLTLLQPSLEPLPPYILSEAQLRSQRYCLFSGGGSTGGVLPGVGSYCAVPPGPRLSRRSESTCWGTAKTRPGLVRAELADQCLGQETPGSRKTGKAGRRHVIARLYK